MLKKVTALQMHRLHCGSNKVRRGSWPPQVSFVSRLLPPRPERLRGEAWRGADRVALAVSNAAYRGLVSMVSGTGLASCTGAARRARRGTVIPMRLADC